MWGMALTKGEKIALALLALFLLGTLLWAVRAARPGVQVETPASALAVLKGADAGADGETADDLAPVETVDLNTATAEELQRLPGVGKVLAERIIAYRTENGAFTVPEELMKVKGIGKAKFDAVKDRITVNTKGGTA